MEVNPLSPNIISNFHQLTDATDMVRCHILLDGTSAVIFVPDNSYIENITSIMLQYDLYIQH